MKTVYILIGPKGSGKTYIGELLERKLAIRFLSVESYFLYARKDYEVIDEKSFAETWKKIDREISAHFKSHNNIIFESIGTFDSFKTFLKSLQERYKVFLIQVQAPLDVCLERINKRDLAVHVPMSEKLIKKINQMAVKEIYQFDTVIDNVNSSDKEIVEKFRELL
ncbi:MAG: AAA family ATPase [Candidatus Nanoarchaeia archaeon]|nr:AAA family ATPase [Candidatus Nanoarchaeia archaeon]